MSRREKTPRRPLDFYPTPPDVTHALALWLEQRFDGAHLDEAWLDPAAGDGDLIEAMRDHHGETHWTALELDHRQVSGRIQSGSV